MYSLLSAVMLLSLTTISRWDPGRGGREQRKAADLTEQDPCRVGMHVGGQAGINTCCSSSCHNNVSGFLMMRVAM